MTPDEMPWYVFLPLFTLVMAVLLYVHRDKVRDLPSWLGLKEKK